MRLVECMHFFNWIHVNFTCIYYIRLHPSRNLSINSASIIIMLGVYSDRQTIFILK